jgi:hypothetical protein
MSEIAVLEPSENLPIIGQHEGNSRNAVTLWLQGFRSENTRRAYRRELEASLLSPSTSSSTPAPPD